MAYTPTDYNAAYKQAQKYKQKALDAEYAATKANIDAEGKALKGEYDAARNETYVGARKKALAANEALAAQGLSRGTYEVPTSGYAETQRQRQDAALRAGIAEADRQEQSARDGLAQEIINAGYAKDAGMAEYMAGAYIDQINQQTAQQQYQQQYDWQREQADIANRQWQAQYDWQAEQAAIAQQQWQEQQEYQKALDEVNTYGKVLTKASAKILGVPVGTTSAAYKMLQGVR